MISLPLTKRWTGDGWGSANARLLTQLKRSQNNALYQVSEEKTGKVTGYEVFKVRILPKGTVIFEEVKQDDEEQYPTASQFGHTAWSVGNIRQAELVYNRLEAGQHPTKPGEPDESESGESGEPEPENPNPGPSGSVAEPVKRGRGRPPKSERPTIQLPPGEFKMQDVADLNSLNKANVYVMVQEFIAAGKVKETRRVSSGRGRPTVMYQTVPA